MQSKFPPGVHPIAFISRSITFRRAWFIRV